MRVVPLAYFDAFPACLQQPVDLPSEFGPRDAVSQQDPADAFRTTRSARRPLPFVAVTVKPSTSLVCLIETRPRRTRPARMKRSMWPPSFMPSLNRGSKS